MKKVGPYWYADNEERLHRSHSRYTDIDHSIMPHVDALRTCVQAGGAVGVWPIHFARHFDSVISFEPNPTQIECFRRNVAESGVQNVELVEAGLWSGPGKCKMSEHEPNNLGSWYVNPSEGEFPLLALDSLELSNVDLLQLDIEGAELPALQGASKTIMESRPVIVLELKQTVRHFGNTIEQIYTFLGKHKYKHVVSFSRDQLWTPY